MMPAEPARDVFGPAVGRTMPRLEPDRSEAERFLLALVGSLDTPVTFQTFCDPVEWRDAKANNGIPWPLDSEGDPADPLASWRHGTLAQRWNWLVSMNEAGAGVFVMVAAGDGKGRRERNVVTLRALFIDDDTATLNPDALEFPPSIVVRSRHGPHAYWCLREGEPLDAFKPAQLQLAGHLRTDSSINDLPRVMRLPGFLHQKDRANPFLVSVVQANDSRFTIAEVLAGYGLAAEPEPASRANGKAYSSQAATGTTDGGPLDAAALERARLFLSGQPQAVKDAHGDTLTYRIVAHLLRDLAVPQREAMVALLEWDARNSPPWGEAPLRQKIVRVLKYGRNKIGSALPSAADAPLTDAGNAQRFVAEHGAHVLCCGGIGRWFVYDGKRWVADDTFEVERLAKETVRRMYSTAAQSPNPKEIAAWALKSESGAHLDALLKRARSDPAIVVRQDELDGDPWVLNVANGTIDLRTGQLRPHDPADLITKLAPVEYEPSATCPTWDRFLEQATDERAELAGFLRRLAGYSLTGDNSAEVMPAFMGKAASGKTTMTGILQEVAGDYARTGNPELLLTSRNDGGANKASPDLIALRGARLVVFAETAEGRGLSSAMLKRAVSTDRISARALYQGACEFTPTHKAILMTNHRPRVRAADEGTWRRILHVPFDRTCPEKDRDNSLRDKLRAELPGILAWAVRGCLEWQEGGGGRAGLAAPDCVLNATRQYREEEDPLAPFLADACVIDHAAKVLKGDLFKAYETWCERNKEPAEGRRAFDARIADMDHVDSTRIHGGNRAWTGIGLKLG
jgi:P4 family phage/plasmid primase-like protien